MDPLKILRSTFVLPFLYALATGNEGWPIGEVSWEKNQKTYKPDGNFGYRTDGVTSSQNYVTFRMIAFVARPRSKAVGAQAGVGGALRTDQEIDLKARFSFDVNADEHSAQFNWNIQRLGGFYQTLLDRLFPPQ